MEKPSENSPQPNTTWLTKDDFEFLCFNTAKEFMTFDEPIPEYETRNIHLLESSLGSPQQTFGGNYLYPTLSSQAAMLFYSLIKNHPFKNGNKRIAVMALLVFLSLNKKWLKIAQKGLYEIALLVSSSDARMKDDVLASLGKAWDDFIIDFTQPES